MNLEMPIHFGRWLTAECAYIRKTLRSKKSSLKLEPDLLNNIENIHINNLRKNAISALSFIYNFVLYDIISYYNFLRCETVRFIRFDTYYWVKHNYK